MKKILIGLVSLGAVFSINAKTYAIVGDKKITDKEINSMLDMLPNGQMIKRFGFDRLLPQEKKKILNIIVENILLAKKAYQDGIDKTDEYKEKLKSIKDNLAVELYTKKIISNIKVTDKEAKEYYENHKAEYAIKDDLAKARHILVKTKQEAENIIDELKKAKKGEVEQKFIELAKSKSIGPSKKYGGELGWFNRARMVPEFSKAVFSMKKGEFSKEPVKTQFGYHVIYLEDFKKKGTVKPFEEVIDKIKEKLRREKIEKALQKDIDEMKKSVKVIFKEEA